MAHTFVFDKYHKKKDKRYDTEDNNRASIRVYCKYCKHPNTIPAFLEEKVCSWCHKKIKNTSNAHFKYKLINMLKEKKESEK